MKNDFIIKIGSSPEPLVSDIKSHIKHDLDLIKSCLLYADKISVCSPLGNLFTSLNTIREHATNSTFEEKIKVFDNILKNNLARPEIAIFLESINQLKKVKYKTKELIIAKKKLEKEIERVWNEFRKKDFEFSEGDNINLILSLFEKKILDYYFFEISDNENTRIDLAFQFERYLTQSISDPYSHVLLDDYSGKFISELHSSGKHSVSEIDKKRANEVALASNLFERLPSFDLATIDELLDIKKELKKYLVDFRSGIIKLNENINSSHWDNNFIKEVEYLFRKEIEPSILGIEEEVKSNNYLSKLITRIADKPFELTVPLFGFGVAGQVANIDLLSYIFDTVLLGANFYKVYEDYKEEKRDTEHNQFFFYFKAGKMLRK
ncbi:MAG: hypothetical protein WCZ90_20230 [Melioribacteraceae bacterium]